MSSTKIPHRRPIRSGNNSTAGEKIAERLHGATSALLGGRTVIKVVALVIALLLIGGGVFWYKDVFTNPTHVFWSMVGNNLSTTGVTKQTSQKVGSTTNDQLTQLIFGPTPYVRNIRSTTTNASSTSTKIEIESIGTPTDTYQHYILVEQPAKAGKPKSNYSKVYPLWLKNGGGGQSDPRLFDNSILSGFLFGNLDPTQKTLVMHDLRQAYSVDFANVQTKRENGRRLYIYGANLSLKTYAQAVQVYAKALGLPIAAQINPNNYQTSAQLTLIVKVDVLSHQLKQVIYNSGATTENYSSYGIIAALKLPTNTVSYNTLQQAVNAAASTSK